MKRSLIGILFLLFFLVSHIDVYAEVLTSINFSYNENVDIELEIKEQKINIVKIPKSKDFEYIAVGIYDMYGNEVIEKWFHKNDDLIINIASLSDGIYFLTVYRNYNQYGDYYSYFKRLPLQVEKKKAVFILPNAAEENIKIRETKREDKEALDFYRQPDYMARSDAEEIIALANKLTKNIKKDYDKALVIYDWVSSNIFYDHDAVKGKSKRIENVVNILDQKKAVCTGYANLTVALLRAVDIPAKIIIGNTIYDELGSGHAWCEAYIGGRWVVIDSTAGSNNYVNQGKNRRQGFLNPLYFDSRMETFSFEYIYSDYEEDLFDEIMVVYEALKTIDLSVFLDDFDTFDISEYFDLMELLDLLDTDGD